MKKGHAKEFVPIVNPGSIHNKLYKAIGAAILIINKLRHDCGGYTTPRTFSMSEYEKAINYDINVAENWLFLLSRYSNSYEPIKDKVVLELGPGADLGVGLYLLFKGVLQYNALDVNNLVDLVPNDFYNHFFQKLERLELAEKLDIDFLRSQLEMTLKNNNDRLNYICRKDFSLSVFEKESVDLVFSQAAFEHFDNVKKTVRQLSEVTKPGAILISKIDLKTHSRWIRDKDPLNIFRYAAPFYSLCKFRGSPNRLRPFQYYQIFQEHGWKNIKTIPNKVLEGEYLKKVWKSVNKRFRDEQNEMGLLSITLCATKH